MSRGISPPPTKRRKLSNSPKESLAPPSLPPDPPSPTTLRIFSWNINGIAPFLQNPITSYFQPPGDQKGPHAPASLRGFLRRHHWPAILLLQEVKIAHADTKMQDAVRKAVNTRLASEKGNRRGPMYDVYFVLPTDRQNARGLGGAGRLYGVCSLVRSDLAEAFDVSDVKHRTVDWDREGRVGVIALAFAQSPASSTSALLDSHSPPSPASKRGNRNIAIFNIYAVNGTDSPYRHPQTGAVIGARHDRKLAFHRLLMEECLTLQREGWDIVMAGDFNVAPRRIDGWPNLRTWPAQHVLNRADFLRKFLRDSVGKEDGKKVGEEDVENKQVEKRVFRGVDVWREMHRSVKRFTYYPRTREWGSSCDRVDYVIAVERMWDEGRIAAAGILDNEMERGPSDHVPIWVDVKISPDHDTAEHRPANLQ